MIKRTPSPSKLIWDNDWLKATFAKLTKNSQDVLNIAWTQSLASA